MHQKKTIHQKHVKAIAVLQKQIKELNSTMEAAGGKAKFHMVNQMNKMKKRLLVKKDEQALHFKEGCALAKKLNNRAISVELRRCHKELEERSHTLEQKSQEQNKDLD